MELGSIYSVRCRCCVCSRGMGPGDEADDLSANYTTVICAERKQNSVLSSWHDRQRFYTVVITVIGGARGFARNQ